MSNYVQKIVRRFIVNKPGVSSVNSTIKSRSFVRVRPQHILTHDNTAAVLDKYEQLGSPPIFDPKQPIFALDHNVQDKSEKNLAKYARIEKFAKERGISFFPAGRGIGHQVMCEEGYAWPGTLAVASDSHSNMYGGLGCLGTPVVRTDAAGVWATGELWWQVPPISKIKLEGKLPSGVSGKDVIVALCSAFNNDEVLNHAVEFELTNGAELSVDDRLTIANMTTEFGCVAGIFYPDSKVVDWLSDAGIKEERLQQLQNELPELKPDDDAKYTSILRLNLDSLTPHVAGPNSVKVAKPLIELEKQEIKVQKAYLLSCVNARASDINRAAAVFEGGLKVHPSVEFYVAAASDREQRIAADAFQTLIDAGATPLPPGCGPCIGLGQGLLNSGEVGISATNRNFKGRMGAIDADCYLSSPEVVAASAIAGHIKGPTQFTSKPLDFQVMQREEFDDEPDYDTHQKIVNGFPQSLNLHALGVLDNNINTDAIYPGKYTYDETITPAQQAEVAFENYDKNFGKVAQSANAIVAGFNFGTGSSREQAATCLKHFGIRVVIAGSFSETYKRNAINNGLIVIECPELVRDLQEQGNVGHAPSGDPHPAPSAKPGDWMCPTCSTHNFLKALKCVGPECDASRPTDPKHFFGGYNDWICSDCGGFCNGKMSQVHCFHCAAPRVGNDTTGIRLAIQPRSEYKLGDWRCSNCLAHNFASRDRCFVCHSLAGERVTAVFLPNVTFKVKGVLVMDFLAGTIRNKRTGAEYTFTPPGEVAQELIASGGLEATIANSIQSENAQQS